VAEIQIRRARVAEIDTLVNLWMVMMREHEELDPGIRLSPAAAEHYRSYLQMHMLDANAFVLVAVEGQRAIGFALAMKCLNLPMFQPEQYGYVSDMMVLPSHRRLGIGQKMLDRLMDWFRQSGIRCLQLQVYSGNEDGRRFWQRAGFRDFLHRMWLDL
jgi:ribosomal protein S18 acetylase RimI-like enzyme